MIHSHSSMLPTQRTINLQRQLTENQRQQAEFDKHNRDAQLAAERQMELELESARIQAAQA